jgi:hypothetical protein
MPGMNSGGNVSDPTVVAAFEAALLHQALIALLIFAALGLAWLAVRTWPAAQHHPGRPLAAPGSRVPAAAEPAGRRVTAACLADWVLVEDFGFFGGLGTDPNSMPPFALLAVAGYLALARVPAPPAGPARAGTPARWPDRIRLASLRRSVTAGDFDSGPGTQATTSSFAAELSGAARQLLGRR